MSTNSKKKWDRKRITKTIKTILLGKNLLQVFLRIYVLTVILGAVLLYSGWTHKAWSLENTTPYTFWDALFVSCSAFTNTGLTAIDIAAFYNFFGQFIIFVLIGLGGIGIISLFFIIWNWFKKSNEIKIDHLILLQSERGNNKYSSSYKSIRFCVIFIVLTEIIFGLLMSFWLCFVKAYVPMLLPNTGSPSLTYDDKNHLNNTYHNYLDALWAGMFTSVSAMNNAGFDIFETYSSIAMFRNDWGIVFQMMIVILIIIGGVGYPLIFDIYESRRRKHLGLSYRYSLFTKVGLSSYFIVLFIGLAISYGFEFGAATSKSLIGVETIHHEWGNAKTFNQIFAIFFNTVSTRSAGFSSFDQNLLTEGSKINYSIMMFIGANPSSTGGGIRTTTFAIMFISIWHLIRGYRNVSLFKKTIPSRTVRNSFIITFVAFLLVLISSVIIFYSTTNNKGVLISNDPNFNFTMVLYEVTSAFGTVGLTTGITNDAGTTAKIVLIINMFIGQLGVSTALLVWFKKMSKSKDILYPSEDVKIG